MEYILKSGDDVLRFEPRSARMKSEYKSNGQRQVWQPPTKRFAVLVPVVKRHFLQLQKDQENVPSFVLCLTSSVFIVSITVFRCTYMAQWSVYLPYTMTVQVQILLTSTGFHCNDSFENKEINKRGRDESFKVVPASSKASCFSSKTKQTNLIFLSFLIFSHKSKLVRCSV